MNSKLRTKKHNRIRRIIAGDAKRPRLAVFKSNKHICAQLIDDNKRVTLIFESDVKIKKEPKSERAYNVGKNLALKALKNKINSVVFDRGGFLYHGRVAQIAKGAREAGLRF